MTAPAELALLLVALTPLLAVGWLLLGSALTALALSAAVSRLLHRPPRC